MHTRREFLTRLGDGFGTMALAAMLAQESHAAEAEKKPPDTAKARSVIQIFCPGGLSHVDTWDYRPELEKADGKPFDAELG